MPETASQGALVCSCFKVHANTIKEAIEQGTNSLTDLGKRLKCGTNCGSCKSELAQLVIKYGRIQIAVN